MDKKLKTERKKYNGIGLENSELYALLETPSEQKEEPQRKNEKDKTEGTVTGGAAPLKAEGTPKFLTPDD